MNYSGSEHFLENSSKLFISLKGLLKIDKTHSSLEQMLLL